MAGEVVTLYIDDTSLRLLVAKGKRVKQWADLPLEPGLVRDGVVVDEAKVAAGIKELLEAQKVKVTKVIAGLSGLHCVFRVITVPRLPKAVLAEAVKREAEKVIAVPLEQLYLSWQIISTSKEELTVFLAVFPQDAANSLIRTLRLAALDPYLIDLKPLALARLVGMPTAVIANVQATEVDIVVMVDKVPQVIRTLSLPGEAQSWPEKLPLIKEELDRTLKFYDSSHSANPLDAGVPIFVSGELAQESEACTSLANELERPVSPLSPPLQCPEGLPAGQYVVNVGLALKAVSLPRARANFSVVNLNALPEVYWPKARSLAGFLAVPGIIIAIGLLAFLVMLVQNTAADVASLQAELDTTNQLLIQEQRQMNDIAELERKVGEAVTARDTLAGVHSFFGQQRTEVSDDLRVAMRTLPGTVDLSSLTRGNPGLTLSGMALSEEGVWTYANNLSANVRFSQVIVSSIRQTEDGVSFSLILIR